MVDHHERARAVRIASRKYVANQEEFLGLDAEGHIVSVEALAKMLRKIDEFCGGNTRLLVRFTDGADCVPADIDEVVKFLRKETEIVDGVDLYCAFDGLAGTYVVKNTTIAELSCRVRRDCFEVSARRLVDNSIDFEPLLGSLRGTISHLPKKERKLANESQKSATIMSLALGLLCAMIVTALPMLSRRGRELYAGAVFVYLLLTLVVAVVIGFVIAMMVVVPLFNNIMNGDRTDVLIGEKKTLGKSLKILRLLDKHAPRLLMAELIMLLAAPVAIIWLF